MAKQTRSWLTSARPHASRVAPTAPHAGDDPLPRKTGPEKFWNKWRVRIALGIALPLSFFFHASPFVYWSLPGTPPLKFNDVDDELTIPVDLISDLPEAPPPQPPEQSPTPDNKGEGPGGKDGGAPKQDAAAPKDASAPPDASGISDAAIALETTDASTPLAKLDLDAAVADNAGDASMLSFASDAGPSTPGVGGARDPASMIGLSSVVTAGPTNVTALINVETIRKHPVGSRMGPLLSGIPQWREFLHGSETKFDPLKAADWILIFGPSLIHTDRDAIYVRTNIPDPLTDSLIDKVSAGSSTQGGAFDTGVPGVHAAKTWADNGARVMMRVQPHVVLVVPPDKAKEFARANKRAPVHPHLSANEAARFIIHDPWRQISIPNLHVPRTVSEIRIWIVPRDSDGSADAYMEADCGTPEAAAETRKIFDRIISDINSNLVVRIASRGLLNGVEMSTDGSQMKAHLPASREQLEALLAVIAAQLGVNVEPPPGGAP